ncbi:hypothetical protein NKJ74_23265 [Mesorhizobium sp. M0046]|uniref:hypothetical protein n=1 Tax=Mesorhizobium sp. M0046 TaxID=2956858 RepID=UPI00333CCF0D
MLDATPPTDGRRPCTGIDAGRNAARGALRGASEPNRFASRISGRVKTDEIALLESDVAGKFRRGLLFPALQAPEHKARLIEEQTILRRRSIRSCAWPSRSPDDHRRGPNALDKIALARST